MGLGYIQADGALVLAFDLLTDVRNRLFLIPAMGHDCNFRYLPNIEPRFLCVLKPGSDGRQRSCHVAMFIHSPLLSWRQ